MDPASYSGLIGGGYSTNPQANILPGALSTLEPCQATVSSTGGPNISRPEQVDRLPSFLGYDEVVLLRSQIE